MAQLNVTELDFDNIKANLKTFLNSQTEFTDYNFEGSGLAVLIDLLAYNTHYNGILAHMLANENFLNVEQVVKKPAYECLTFMSYKKDVNQKIENEYRRNKV